MESSIHLTDAEWEVMRVIWANTEVASSEVINVLQEKTGWKESTIKTLLGRLVDKGALETVTKGRHFLYSSKVTKSSSLNKLTRELLDKVCKTHQVDIVSHLINQASLDQPAIDKLMEQLLIKKETASQIVKCECTIGQCECNHFIEGEHHE